MSPALAGKFLKSRQILDHQGRPIIIILFKYYLFGCAGSLLCHSLVAQTVKSLPEMRETQVRSLGWEDPPREGNGNPLQDSCLENPMDGGVW